MNVKKNKKDDISALQDEVKHDIDEKTEEVEKAEIISKKKVLYADIDDEITTIYDKIRPLKMKNIYIVVPQRSILFQSIVNLKILKRKMEDDGKSLFLITNDKNGIYMAAQIGIPVYNREAEGKPVLFSTEVSDEKLKITPLKASVNSLEEEAPTRMAEKKISISEILQKFKGFKKTVDVKKIESQPKKEKSKSKFVIVAPNRQALIGLIVATLCVLLVVVYIALPGVTIYVTPAASVLEKSVNITLADSQKNGAELQAKDPHMIASYPIETTVTKTITHYATGKKISEKGANSSGKIMIYNLSGNTWPLVGQTRFQTKEGIVFRIASSVTVPPATTSGPGKIEAFVTADPTDAYGSIVGAKGNIGPTRFFLPALRDDSKSKIYAENTAPMTGGVTDYLSFVSDKDLDAAKSRAKDEVLKDAVQQLKIAIQEKAKLAGGDTSKYTLLEGDSAIEIGEVKISAPTDIINKDMNEFNVTASVSIKGLYYDSNEMMNILVQELEMKKSPQKKLLRINEDSSTYRIFERDTASGKVKLTANIKGIEEFSIDPTTDNGSKFLEKIRQHIVGKNIEEAKNYIQNLTEINKVEIESWPAWAPTIPGLAENIDFEVRDAVNAE
ncbi:hypothetical protein M0P48_00570 [Candidatus Gracilibacteria bacterium]|nr:hypothetical protein [Candidatus Gracilibacteria bacterium]